MGGNCNEEEACKRSASRGVPVHLFDINGIVAAYLTSYDSLIVLGE